VTESVLLPGAFVDAGAQVRGSIVAGRVGVEAIVDASLIGVGYAVADGGHVVDAKLPATN
jgi:hypothetical protein